MVSCPFNSREGGKCFVTARGRMRMTMLVLSRQPSLGWRAWRYYSSLIMIVDGIGVWLGPSAAPLFLGSSIPSDGRRNMRRFVYFRTDAHTLLGVTRYFTYICVSPSSSSSFFLSFFLFFFFFGDAWGSIPHWWLTGGVAHVVATCSTSIGWEAPFPVEIFLVFLHFPR